MTRRRWARLAIYAGLVLMVVGLVDPLEGSVVIVGGTVLVAVGAFLLRSRHARLAYAGCALVAAGVAALFILSGFGGVGGPGGQAWWWALTLAPYPVGWVVTLGAVLRMRRDGFGPPRAA